MEQAQAIRIDFRRPARAPRGFVQSIGGGATVTEMTEPASSSDRDLGAEEARLARAAAAGDGDAFATLYERYARRAFNLAHRLSGSEEDAADAVQEAFLNVMRRLPRLDQRELAFGSYLFTATRNATYDLLRRQQQSRPSDSIPESAVPVGAGAGGLGLDPGDPDEDPDRKVLLSAQREEIREANARLPERQREALALRELEDLSYDEIAALMEMNRNSVAQLISRARLNLRDELRGTALASIAVASPVCERALPLIAAREDGQLDEDGADAAWLTDHLASCRTCAVATEAMQEAGVSYRAWIPLAISPWLFKATMAKAAELTGSDWSAVTERRLGSPADPGAIPGLPPAYREGKATATGTRRRGVAIAAVLAALALSAGVGAATLGDSDDPPSAAPAFEAVDAVEPAVPVSEPKPTAKHKRVAGDEELSRDESTIGVPAPESSPAGAGNDSRPPPKPSAEPNQGAIHPPQAVTESGREPTPEPEPTPPAETPPSEEPAPPVEPPVREPPSEIPPGAASG